MYHNQMFIVNVWDPKTCFNSFMQWIFIFFRVGLMMIPRESKHVAQGQ